MSVTKPARRSPNAPGQALAEFALVAPIFFLLVFGVIQLGLIFGAQNALVDGVRDATRKAATYRVSEDTYSDPALWASICDAIEQTLLDSVGRYPGADTSAGRLTPTIAYEWVPDPTGPGYSFVAYVSAVYAHPVFLPIDPLLAIMGLSSTGAFQNSIDLGASEQMRVENPSLDAPTNPAPSC